MPDANQKGRQPRARRSEKTYELVITAMFVAMTFAATWLINIRFPFMGTGGLIHLGNVPLFVAAMLYGKKTGAIAGGLGMSLFDLMSGWTAWAPFTLVIVGLMGFTVGLMEEKQPVRNSHVRHALEVILAIVIKVIGYYFAEVILTGNWIAPVGSIPGNVVQVGVAGVLVCLFIEPLKRAVLRGAAVGRRSHV